MKAIEKMHALLNGNNPIVGYDASGKVITRKQYMEDIKEAEEQFGKGEFTIIEDLEKDSETW